jgi:lipid-A-disaccharide synthase
MADILTPEHLRTFAGMLGGRQRPLRFALVAGEASGDQLGAGLVEELRGRYPGAEFAGIGGERMRAAGMQAWHDCSELAVMGLAEVLRHLPRLWLLRRRLGERLLEWKPDVFVGIDAPDFNLGLEKRLKRAGLRTVHYVSPSVWAWREGRAARIGASADLVLCLFPMEPAIYGRHGIAARFVGHPLADSFALRPDAGAARASLGLPVDKPVLALLPGSRRGEIGRLLAPFLEAAGRVHEEFQDLVIAIPAANGDCRRIIEAGLSASGMSNVALYDGRAHEVMVASDVVLLASGTAALEAMLAKRPMVVGYRISALSHRIVSALGLLRISRYSLPNVLANEPVVPELMQDDCTPANLADALLLWLRDPEAIARLRPRFEAIHERLRQGASAKAADAIASLLPLS